MKRILFLILGLLFTLQGYCQRFANIHSQKINKSFYGGANVKMDRGNLILYKGNQFIRLYIEKWPGEYVYQGDKLIKLSKLKIKNGDYCILEQNGEDFELTIRGGDFVSVKLQLSKDAKEYFQKYSSPSHAAHYSHMSGSHTSHYSHYSGK